MRYMSTINKKRAMETQLICTELVGKGIAGVLRFISYYAFRRSELGTYLFIICFTILLLRYILVYFHSKTVKRIIEKISVTAILLLCSFLVFSETRKYVISLLPYVLEVLIIGIAAMVLVSQVDDWSNVLHSLGGYLRIIVPLLCLTHLLGGVAYWGYMSWGLRILPLTLLYYAYIRVEGGTRLDRILFGLSFVFTLFGGRQSLVLLLGTIITISIYQFAVTKFNRKSLVFILGTFLLSWLLVFHYDGIMNIIERAISIRGINSRSLQMLVQNRLLDDNNRSKIYSLCLSIIREKGIEVSGIFADRYYLGLYGFEGYFAHNFLLEILIDFGLLAGSLILLKLIYDFIKCFFKCAKQYKAFFFVMIGIGLGRFFVSGSIFMDSLFWVLVGFLHNEKLKYIGERKS